MSPIKRNHWDGSAWNGTVEVSEFILGTTKPNASNTGVPAGTSLTVVTTNQTHNTDNATYEGYDFQCYVDCNATNVTYRNCKFSGNNAGWTGLYGWLNTEGATNATVERCTFRATNPKYWSAGIKGKNTTVHRCDFSASVDGIVIRGGNMVITGNYFHDFYFYDLSTEQTNQTYNPEGWTHNDAIQWHVDGGAGASPNHVVRGNNIDWYAELGLPDDRTDVLFTGYMSGNSMDPGYTTGTLYRRPVTSEKTGRPVWGTGITLDCPSVNLLVTNVDIYENWISAGVLFQAGQSGSATHNWGKIRNNRCDQDLYTNMTYNHWYAIRYDSSHTPNDSSGNYWMDVATVDVADRGTLLTVGVNQGLEQA